MTHLVEKAKECLLTRTVACFRCVKIVDATLIQARVVRLESELNVAYRERHDFSYQALRKAQKRILYGERLNAPGMVTPSYTSSHSYSFVPNSMGSSPP